MGTVYPLKLSLDGRPPVTKPSLSLKAGQTRKVNCLLDSGELGPVRDCHSRCIEVATGVLMARHGLTAVQVRDTFLGAAERQSESLHVWARLVIDSAVALPHTGSRPAPEGSVGGRSAGSTRMARVTSASYHPALLLDALPDERPVSMGRDGAGHRGATI